MAGHFAVIIILLSLREVKSFSSSISKTIFVFIMIFLKYSLNLIQPLHVVLITSPSDLKSIKKGMRFTYLLLYSQCLAYGGHSVLFVKWMSLTSDWFCLQCLSLLHNESALSSQTQFCLHPVHPHKTSKDSLPSYRNKDKLLNSTFKILPSLVSTTFPSLSSSPHRPSSPNHQRVLKQTRKVHMSKPSLKTLPSVHSDLLYSSSGFTSWKCSSNVTFSKLSPPPLKVLLWWSHIT